MEQAEAAGCDLAAFPELAITGYPPEDLVLKPGFVADNELALQKVAARTGRCAAIVGFVDAELDRTTRRCVRAATCSASTASACCPTTPVFDEQRYFTPGNDPLELYVVGGVRVGVSVCEDVEPARADRAAGRPAGPSSW